MYIFFVCFFFHSKSRRLRFEAKKISSYGNKKEDTKPYEGYSRAAILSVFLFPSLIFTIETFLPFCFSRFFAQDAIVFFSTTGCLENFFIFTVTGPCIVRMTNRLLLKPITSPVDKWILIVILCSRYSWLLAQYLKNPKPPFNLLKNRYTVSLQNSVDSTKSWFQKFAYKSEEITMWKIAKSGQVKKLIIDFNEPELVINLA